MKVSTKGRYGIRALIDLAVHSKSGHVSLISIATRNQISIHYLEHVFASLKRSGIVKSVKGAQGGYILADEPENINVAQIILALEGSYAIDREAENADPQYENISAVMDTLLWDKINDSVEDLLQNITLADLVNAFLTRHVAQSGMYYI